MVKRKTKRHGEGVTTRHKTRGMGGFGSVSRSPTVSAPHKKKARTVRGSRSKRIKKPKTRSKRLRK